MNYSDLFVVVVLVSALYALIVALTGRRHFLASAVNPHRWSWLLAAFTLFWVGVSLLRLEAKTWEWLQWMEMLSQLISDAPTPARVKVAAVSILLSVVFLSLLSWCWLFLPRDPSTYHKPAHRKAAMRYYVTRLKGGLGYGLLVRGDGSVLEEVVDQKHVQWFLPHLPKVRLPDHALRERTTQEQVEFWRPQARRIHEQMGLLDALIAHAHQGRNRRLVFDGEYGGLFFKYLRLPDPSHPQETGLYLFGATLSQSDMDSRKADQHFQLLLAALQSVERSIRMG